MWLKAAATIGQAGRINHRLKKREGGLGRRLEADLMKNSILGRMLAFSIQLIGYKVCHARKMAAVLQFPYPSTDMKHQVVGAMG